jgi:YD repeat-containing protein
MTYDAAGNLLTTTDDNGRVTTTSYDTYALYPVAVTDPLGHVTATEVDYRWGQPDRIVDPNGAETYITYDVAGRPVCAARPGDSVSQCTTTTTYHFAAAPAELSWWRRRRQDGPHPPCARATFDALGRARYSEASRVVDGLPTTVRSNQVDYDPAGRVARLYDPYLTTAGAPDNGSTLYDYHLNGDGRIDPLGRIHQLTASDGTQRRTHYDGARMTSWDEEGQRTEADLDSLGRTVERRTYDGETLVSHAVLDARPRPRPRHRSERRDPADVHLRLARSEDADGRCRLRHLALRIRWRRQPALAGRSARRPAPRDLLRRRRPPRAGLSVGRRLSATAVVHRLLRVARGGDLRVRQRGTSH